MKEVKATKNSATKPVESTGGKVPVKEVPTIRSIEDAINKERRAARKPFGFVIMQDGSNFILARAVWHLLDAIRLAGDVKKASIVGTYATMDDLLEALKPIRNGQKEV